MALGHPSCLPEWKERKAMDDPFERQGVAIEGKSRWMLLSAVATGLLAALSTTFMVGRGSADPPMVMPTATPTATPTPHVVSAEAIVNGVHLFDDDRVRWLGFYRANEDLLGEPVRGPFAAESWDTCYAFTFYQVCHDDRQKGLWAYVPLALGYDALPDGMEPILDADVAAVPQAFIADIRAGGRDPLYWIGRSISDPLCGEATCVQFFERSVLQWLAEVGVESVSRLELGENGD
jgi:hypothetical protein